MKCFYISRNYCMYVKNVIVKCWFVQDTHDRSSLTRLLHEKLHSKAIAVLYQPFKNQTIQNLDIFVWILNGFWQNSCHLSRFPMVGLPDLNPIQSQDHWQTILFLTIGNLDLSWFQIPLYTTFQVSYIKVCKESFQFYIEQIFEHAIFWSSYIMS